MKIEYLWNFVVFILSYLKSGPVAGIFHFLQIALLKGSIADGGASAIYSKSMLAEQSFCSRRQGKVRARDARFIAGLSVRCKINSHIDTK